MNIVILWWLLPQQVHPALPATQLCAREGWERTCRGTVSALFAFCTTKGVKGSGGLATNPPWKTTGIWYFPAQSYALWGSVVQHTQNPPLACINQHQKTPTLCLCVCVCVCCFWFEKSTRAHFGRPEIGIHRSPIGQVVKQKFKEVMRGELLSLGNCLGWHHSGLSTETWWKFRHESNENLGAMGSDIASLRCVNALG